MVEPSQDFPFSSNEAPRPLDDHVIPAMALALGFGGVLPFLVCAAAIWTGWKPPLVAEPAAALMGYAAVILSFLGGIRWGLALRIAANATQSRMLAESVIPSIAAWLSLLLPVAYGLSAMAGLFLVLGIADTRLPRHDAPMWYARLRVGLTFIVAPLLAIAAVGLRWAN